MWCVLLIMTLHSVIENLVFGKFEILCNQLIFLMNKRNVLIIDIRNHIDYDSGYIMNSLNIPFKNINVDVGKEDHNFFLRKKFKNEAFVIVNDYVKKSHKIRKYLNRLGFTEVYVLKEGINSWKDQGLPLLSKNK